MTTSEALTTAAAMRAAQSQACPICRAPQARNDRHPRHACEACAARAVDAEGRPVRFSNASLSGGLRSSSQGAPVVAGTANCFIDGVPCVAEEGRFGGVVIQPAAPTGDRLSALTETELLARHGAILAELKRRGILRSKNNPTGDYAEWLVSARLGLTLATNSAKGFDATDGDGVRYQIKARRITPDNPSTQLGVIRNLEGADFDILVAVLFDAEWRVLRAARIPHAAVGVLGRYRPHVNGHVMHFPPGLLQREGVLDLTARF